MHGVRNVAKRVENEFVQSLQQLHGGIGQSAEIGEIRRAAEAEAQHFHVAMEQGNWNERNAEQFEWTIVDNIERDTWHGAESRLIVENVGEDAAVDSKRVFVAVDRKSRALPDVVGTNIIESQNVVGVAVGEKNGVKAIDAGAHGLLAKIGSGVDDHVVAVTGEKNGRAKAFVVRVIRMANAAGAAERGHAHRGAGAENGNF